MAETTRFQRSVTADDAARIRDVDFPIVMRGYDRATVDRYVDHASRLVAELETTQLRENVVQRALDEVGEQTASILQRAHETAEEITAQSRAKAEGRLQRAEREADLLRREADEYAERIVADTRHLWDERQRLIEDMRQLADEVLATADDALDRLPEPEMLRAQALEAAPADDQTTVMPSITAADPADASAATELDVPTIPEEQATDQPTVDFEAPALAVDHDATAAQSVRPDAASEDAPAADRP
jgi:DivIVA domain-containing protein